MPDERREDARSGRWAAPVLGSLIVLHVLLMAALRLYPFVDLPNHLATATIVRYYHESGNEFARYFAVPTLFKPNIVHLAFCAGPVFPTVEAGNKAFVCLYVLLLPLSVALLIRRLRGNPWFAILAFLPLYNFGLGWGVMASTMAVPLTILFCHLVLRHVDGPSLPSAAAVSAALAAMFFVHAQAVLFAMLLFAVVAGLRFRRSVADLVGSALVPVPAVLLVFLWWLSDWSKTEPSRNRFGTLGALLDYYRGPYLPTLYRRATPLLLADNSFLGRTPSMIAVGVALFLAIAALSLAGVLAARRRKEVVAPRPSSLLPRVLLGCSLFGYFCLPLDLPGHQFVSERFAVFVLIGVVLLGSVVSPSRLPRWKIAVICAAALLHLGAWSAYYLGFERRNASFDASVLADPVRGPMGGLIYDHKYRDQPVYIHFPNYQIVWNRGIATTRVVDYRFGIVRRRVREDVLPAYDDWIGGGDRYLGQYASLNTILVHGSVAEADQAYLRDYRVVKRAGAWSLLERP